ncbi:hypothetical protein DAETH_01320 [Deinococcus aetherius]|uniref:Uncharacterized protein n=1 Tax=Deinococcus aetherius TaxID=200252 RepID=A0ABM8A900_9DEIO|nr:hypothetical protein DAETH_01320 [Deinococcus aetherius]
MGMANRNLFMSGVVGWARQITGEGSTQESPPHRLRGDGEEGLGVPVPVGPRPIRGGAHAAFPEDVEDDPTSSCYNPSIPR